jgi:glycosyltransferase involved in cell wall biosynthesis
VFLLSHTRPVDLPRLIVHLARVRRCGRVVVSHSMLGYQLLPWLRTQLPGVAFLDYTHIEYETEWPDGGYALRSVNHQSLLHLAIVSSAHLREWMTERGANPAAIRVCHTNIDANRWAPSAEERARVRFELNVDRKTAMILYPCRLAEQKRPELMCNIVAALRRATEVPFVLVVAGDGPLMAPLKRFVAREGLEDFVRLLGAVSLQRVAQLHNAADIFLLPSLIEGISLALFEAMALESVPVISDVGGQRELVTPDCGHLVPVGHPATEICQYVAKLKHLLENPEKRRAMGAAGRARIREHFRLEQMTDTFIAAMDEAGRRCASRTLPLPHATLCREMATLALDHVRVSLDNSLKLEAILLFGEKMDRQEKIIQRLQRQIAVLRAAPSDREAHEPAY